MNEIDTLVVDTHQLDSLTRANDYMASLHPDIEGAKSSLIDLLLDDFYEMLQRILRKLFGHDAEPMWQFMALLSLIVVVVVLFMYRDRIKRLFNRNRQVDFNTDPDNIYIIDFDTEIADARARGDHAMLVRLFYLKSLRLLADADRITWMPGKTPAQFEREAGVDELTQLTPLFVRVRYGKYTANSDDSAMAEQCHDRIGAMLAMTEEQKGGDDEH